MNLNFNKSEDISVAQEHRSSPGVGACPGVIPGIEGVDKTSQDRVQSLAQLVICWSFVGGFLKK
jgi:hypothetical protein